MKRNRELRRKALVLGDDDRALIAVVRSLGRKGIDVHIGWHPTESIVVHSRYVRAVHHLPPFADSTTEWKLALTDLLQRERFDLVIPCSDPVQIPLQMHRADLERYAKMYLLDDSVFRIVTDKIAMNELARSVGVHVPREHLVRSDKDVGVVATSFCLPLVLKPQSSFDPSRVGERRTVQKAYSWIEFSCLLKKMIASGPVAVQENFIGQGVGVELLLRDGEPLLEFQHVRLHEPLHGGGSSYRQGTRVTPALREAALALLRPLKYTGVAMVEFKVNPVTGDWVFIETNGRFWGSLPLAIASGADFPAALFELLVDGRTPTSTQYQVGLCCRHWSGDLYWQGANLRADRKDPTLATRKLPLVLCETIINLVTFRERSDALVLDDPQPGAVELIQIANRVARSIAGKLRRRWVRMSLVRARLNCRARGALLNAKRILFVCKGNICRSPFAEHFARRLFSEGVDIVSAGYYPASGRRSPDAAVAAASAWDVDLSSHRSVLLTAMHLKDADVIFVFDDENYQTLARDRTASGKLHLLAVMNPDGDPWIDDPYGLSVEGFSRIYRQISSALTAGAPDARLPHMAAVRAAKVDEPKVIPNEQR